MRLAIVVLALSLCANVASAGDFQARTDTTFHSATRDGQTYSCGIEFVSTYRDAASGNPGYAALVGSVDFVDHEGAVLTSVKGSLMRSSSPDGEGATGIELGDLTVAPNGADVPPDNLGPCPESDGSVCGVYFGSLGIPVLEAIATGSPLKVSVLPAGETDVVAAQVALEGRGHLPTSKANDPGTFKSCAKALVRSAKKSDPKWLEWAK